MKVGIIKSNALHEDERLRKEIRTLKKDKIDYTLLCWDRGNNYDNEERETKSLIFKLKAEYGPLVLFFLPIWWIFLTINCIKNRYDIIHVINLDSAAVIIPLSKILNIPTIYEMYDTYEDHLPLPCAVRDTILKFDKYLMKLADAIVLVDECRIEEVGGVPNENISIIYNGPEFSSSVDHGRENNKPHNDCVIFFAGLLGKHRTIETMIEICKEIEGIRIIFAGWGELEEFIKIESMLNPTKVTFLGKLPHDEVIRISKQSDILFSLYDPFIPLNKYASSNKIFEAMMCELPILVSANTSMENVVLANNCGLVVDCRNKAQIKDAILKLKQSPELRRKLGRNGYQAYLDKYSWSIMEKTLINLYNSIGNTTNSNMLINNKR